jgi:hypothetical protein
MNSSTIGRLLAVGAVTCAAFEPLEAQSTGISNAANEGAGSSMYASVEYANSAKPGPALIVIPGEIKGSDRILAQTYDVEKIADFAELELSKANFQVLDRADLGHALDEIRTAYTLGNAEEVRKIMTRGRLKTTKWLVRFDVLRLDHAVQQASRTSGGTASGIIALLHGKSQGAQTAQQMAQAVAQSLETASTAGTWIVGMRYKLFDATTTEQVAQYYVEEKMEVGSKSTSMLGISTGTTGGSNLEALVQSLVQKCVQDIDANHK